MTACGREVGGAPPVCGERQSHAHLSEWWGRSTPVRGPAQLRRNACPHCGPGAGGAGARISNIFKLGTKYSAPLKATILDEREGHPIVMGSYGIGPARMRRCRGQHYDAKGIVWPKSIAPFECYRAIQSQDEVQTGVARSARPAGAGRLELLVGRPAAGREVHGAELIHVRPPWGRWRGAHHEVEPRSGENACKCWNSNWGRVPSVGGGSIEYNAPKIKPKGGNRSGTTDHFCLWEVYGTCAERRSCAEWSRAGPTLRYLGRAEAPVHDVSCVYDHPAGVTHELCVVCPEPLRMR